jgi:hypothetical protein
LLLLPGEVIKRFLFPFLSSVKKFFPKAQILVDVKLQVGTLAAVLAGRIAYTKFGSVPAPTA